MNNKIKKKPLRLRRSVKAGFKLGIFILTALCTVEIAKLGWATFTSRIGAPGGEILIIPLTVLLFYTGWTARKEWTAFKRAYREAERREYHASSTNRPAYKG